MTVTLGIDCGGSGIKAMALAADGTPLSDRLRTPTPYPMSPQQFIDTLVGLTGPLPKPTQVTVGMPGMIRGGVVVHTPHYVRRRGPGTEIDPELAAAWKGFQANQAVAQAFGVPALVLNDAEVHGSAVIRGAGAELVLTLGTGLGSALWVEGRLAPHLELSHITARKGRTLDDLVGEHARRELGNAKWSRRTCKLIAELGPVIHWDRVMIGGGGAKHLATQDLSTLPGSVERIPNEVGMIGGARAWEIVHRGPTDPSAAR
jgi:polyphosphate glucokinase